MKNNIKKVLIVDDMKSMRFVLAAILEKEGYRVITAESGPTAIELVQQELPDIVIMDIKMPEMDGVTAMQRIKEIDQTLPVILITAYGAIDSAVTAVKMGAYDYISKPFDNEKLIITVNNAIITRSLQHEIGILRSNIDDGSCLEKLMGNSNEIKCVRNHVNRIANTNFTVVIYGETGSGKEIVARAIHNLNTGRKGDFVSVDCGAIPETLIESELFGHEKGSFTGASAKKEGYFELASGGTLFLDEIGNLPLQMQSKLLRALEGHCIRRLGGAKDIKIGMRVIVAGNEKLENLVQNGKFREDLYHRLNEFTIEIPPLRRRKDDIIYLAERFLGMTNRELNKNVNGFSEQALEILLNYSWPGNVRELKNVIRRAALMADNTIDYHHLSIKSSGSNANLFDHQIDQALKTEIGVHNSLPLRDIVKKGISVIESRVLTETLKQTGGNKSKAAKMLKIDYKTIHYKIKEYGIKYDL